MKSNKIKPFLTDRQYFEGWERAYCKIRVKRNRRAAKDLDNFFGGGGDSGEDWRGPREPTAEEFLRKLVDDKEIFRERIALGERAGKKFFMEELARKLGLTDFEKHAIVYLFLDLATQGPEPGTHPTSVINSLSENLSMTERARRMGYFSSSGRLARHKIIGYVKPEEGCRSAVFLTEGFQDMISAALDGREVNWRRLEQDSSDEAGQEVFSLPNENTAGITGMEYSKIFRQHFFLS